MAQAVMPSRINVEVLRGNPARLRRERVMRGLFFSAAFLSVVISVGIVVSLAGGTLDFLRKVSLSTLWSDGWFPRNNLFDIECFFEPLQSMDARASFCQCFWDGLVRL